ncbi:MAG: hypothetical protein Q8R44_09935 [Novosphingobium sp.]|nr:hypothetical protein [Novosphingobium sp.]
MKSPGEHTRPNSFGRETQKTPVGETSPTGAPRLDGVVVMRLHAERPLQSAPLSLMKHRWQAPGPAADPA